MNKKYIYIFLFLSSFIQSNLAKELDAYEIKFFFFFLLLIFQSFLFFKFINHYIQGRFFFRFLMAFLFYLFPLIGSFVFLKQAFQKTIDMKKDLINGLLLNLLLLGALNIYSPEKILENSQKHFLNYQTFTYINYSQSNELIVDFFKKERLKNCNNKFKCEMDLIKNFVRKESINDDTFSILVSFHFSSRFEFLKKNKVSKLRAYKDLINLIDTYKKFNQSSFYWNSQQSILPLLNPFLSVEGSIISISKSFLRNKMNKKINEKANAFSKGHKKTKSI